jgi:hypothetical protein
MVAEKVLKYPSSHSQITENDSTSHRLRSKTSFLPPQVIGRILHVSSNKLLPRLRV